MTGGGGDDTLAKFIAGFVCFSTYLIYHLIDFVSTHFAVAFNIPIHNIGIYFSKLFSFRSLLNVYGSIIFLIIKSLEPPSGDVCKYLGIVCFSALFIVRLVLLFYLYLSKSLSYHIYNILSVESFVFGYMTSTLFTSLTKHMVAVALGCNLAAAFDLLVQFVIDLFFYDDPLLMIKIQVWICNIFTITSVCLWAYYIVELSNENNSGSGEIQTTHSKKNFFQTLEGAISPFLMLLISSFFRDFLYPGVLPYALLKRDKCHAINMLVPIINMIGPLILFTLDLKGYFDEWAFHFEFHWLLIIPMIVIFFYSLLAVHTRIPRVRKIANCRWRVLIMTLLINFCFGDLDPLSYAGVARIAKPKGDENKGKGGDERIVTAHDLLAILYHYLYSKLSVGYNSTRVSLGYFLPRFRPNHRMSKWNLFWYMFRSTFRTASRDIVSDFRMNIRDYL